MRKLLLIFSFVFFSCNVNAEKNEYFRDCEKLRNDIQSGIYNYFANLEKDTLRKFPDHKIRADNYLDSASKQANIYLAICKD